MNTKAYLHLKSVDEMTHTNLKQPFTLFPTEASSVTLCYVTTLGSDSAALRMRVISLKSTGLSMSFNFNVLESFAESGLKSRLCTQFVSFCYTTVLARRKHSVTQAKEHQHSCTSQYETTLRWGRAESTSISFGPILRLLFNWKLSVTLT